MKKTLALILSLVLLLSCVSVAGADEIKDFNDYQTISNEIETFCYQYSQKARDLNVLTNCYDHLLTNDPNGALVPCAAYEYTTSDGGQTWTFKLNKGMKWVDYQGKEKAEVIAEDFATGLEWVLNFYKNASANTSMPIQMIKGAKEYYEYTKTLTEEEGKALGLEKFYEMVGVECADDYTITFVCLDKLVYFPTLACYNCLAPLSAKLIEEIGVDGYFGASYDTIWYNGPYTITYFSLNNEKVFTKNEKYWNYDNVKLFDTVTVKMVEDATTAFQLFQNGELDYIELAETELNMITSDPNNEWYDYVVAMKPDKYSYNWKFNFAKNNEDGTPDTNWNLAAANENFRQSIMWGIDWSVYLSRINAVDPLSCQNFVYTMPNMVAKSDGTEYSTLVLDKLGLKYDFTKYPRYDAEKGAAYKKAAIEELTAQGVTFPVELDWYIKGGSQTAADTAAVLTQLFADCLGDDYIKFNTLTYVTNATNEVYSPQLHSITSSGWGADYADPVNFLGQEIAYDDNAFYSVTYNNVDQITDPALLALYDTFTKMVNEAHTITEDVDARYEAFAAAEAYFINHALCIPTYFNKGMQLTCVNDTTKIDSLYGTQSERYVGWETNDEVYTTADYAEFNK